MSTKRDRTGEHERRKQKCILYNICLRCSGPRANDDSLVCDLCQAKRREKRRSQYSQRESNDLCRCGRRRQGNNKLCAICQALVRKSATAQRSKHLQEGTCITCGANPIPGMVSCSSCTARATKRTLERYRQNKALGLCPMCGAETSNINRCDTCLESHVTSSRILWRRYRQTVLDHYGENCSCCGCTRKECLEIDHINNDGKEHRIITGRHIYKWIIDHDFPNNLQVLCANCNSGRAKFGICPHKQEPTTPPGHRRLRRLQCIEAYGSRCMGCGEDNWAFLEFDHVNNDGKEHRKTVKNIIAWMIKNDYPNSIQLLCSNCNRAKQFLH